MIKTPPEWIRESNLIEGVDDPKEDARSWRAWKWLVKQERFTLETLLRLHRKIMCEKLGRLAGALRVVDVRVGPRICPPWQQVKILMESWLATYGGGLCVRPDMNPLVIECAHVGFEKIHPFIDGNGRTGRMIMNWQRVKSGMEPLCIKASERWDYYRWFDEEEFREGAD